jgi:hypothetical protein
MNKLKQNLNTIEESPDDNIDNNNLCIELTYYSDSIPAIKSYYILTAEEYEELKLLHMDLYIENFINSETLTKDKLDIYEINNNKNIIIIDEFIKLYGNPFDILQLINSNKNTKKIIKKQNIDILATEFSDSDDHIIEKNESDSDDYIETMTEIIETYNKFKKVDETKLQKLYDENPNLKNDDVLANLPTITNIK